MKISLKKSKSRECQRAWQDYSPDMKQFIFAIKRWPFAMLSIPKLPVPPMSLINFNLVRDLGLEMHDLQSTKYTIGGRKLRILGRKTLQTIQEVGQLTCEQMLLRICIKPLIPTVLLVRKWSTHYGRQGGV